MTEPIKDFSQYQADYQESVEQAPAFWLRQARNFTWEAFPTTAGPADFNDATLDWFADGRLNITVNALDRHAATHPDRLALLWEPQNATSQPRRFTYHQLLVETEKTGHALRRLGVKAGDTVCLFLPMIPETMIAALACARLGAIHVVVFAGYSAAALAERINDTQCQVVITANAAVRGEKIISLKNIVDEALQSTPSVRHCLVVQREPVSTPIQSGRDLWWHESIPEHHEPLAPVMVQATDPLFILHTSGSTGHPKGVVHAAGGYMVYANYTFANVFQYQPEQIFWCTADVGWITGHSYGIYGPLLQGATVLMTEGSFLYPHPDRLCQIIDQYSVNILYTAPTVLRTLAQYPPQTFALYSLATLKVLGSVGEHLDESTWHWYWRVIGRERLPIVDTWWQTENGGILIATLPGMGEQKPGYAGLPLPGIQPALKQSSKELVITQPWPGLAKTLYKQEQRFRDTYFPDGATVFHTHDEAMIDDQGYVQLLGRNDDVINASGHRLSCADIERALLESEHITEAAVVSRQHPITGEEVCVFVVCPHPENIAYKALLVDLEARMKTKIGRFVSLGVLHLAPELPKTRSGKILRRFLRQLVREEPIGDTSVLANPEGFEALRHSYKNRSN